MFKNETLSLEIDHSVDEVFDEGRNTFLALRRLRWSDKSDYKYDIRKWYIGKDGDEVAGKGISFITEEGPTNLALAMTKNGLVDPILLCDTMAQTDPNTLVSAAAHAMVYHGIPLKDLEKKYKEFSKVKEEEDADTVDLMEAIL